MLELIDKLDFQTLLWIQEHLRSPLATVFWEEITDLGNPATMGILCIGITILFICSKRTRYFGTTALLALSLNLLISNGILKEWIARPRPFITHPEIIPLIQLPTDYSLPSGHSAFSFTIAFVVYRILPEKYGIPVLLLAACIAFSRLYLGVHYPSDVLSGILIGCFVAEASVRFIRRIKPTLH